MIEKYLSEAFQSLKSLNEDIIDLKDSSLEDEVTEIQNNIEDEQIPVIDSNAKDESELEDSYVGKVIIECEVCHSKIYKDAEEIVCSEECDDNTSIVNVEEECPFCYSTDGYKIVGQVAPYQPQELSVEVEPIENDEDVEEGLKDAIVSGVGRALGSLPDAAIGTRVEGVARTAHDAKMESCNKHSLKHLKQSEEECYKEGFSKVELETDNDKIKVTSQPIADEPEQEVLAPLTPEKEAEIKQAEQASEPTLDETSSEDEFEDVDVDELEEESFNSLSEKYFKERYKGAKSFKTTSVKECKNKLVIEGILEYRSGRKLNTQFEFTPKDYCKDGRCSFEGRDTNLSESVRFELLGRVNDNKFITECFKRL